MICKLAIRKNAINEAFCRYWCLIGQKLSCDKQQILYNYSNFYSLCHLLQECWIMNQDTCLNQTIFAYNVSVQNLFQIIILIPNNLFLFLSQKVNFTLIKHFCIRKLQDNFPESVYTIYLIRTSKISIH